MRLAVGFRLSSFVAIIMTATQTENTAGKHMKLIDQIYQIYSPPIIKSLRR